MIYAIESSVLSRISFVYHLDFRVVQFGDGIEYFLKFHLAASPILASRDHRLVVFDRFFITATTPPVLELNSRSGLPALAVAVMA